VVGGLCALLSNVLTIGFVDHGFGVLVATALAFAPVLIVGYALHAVFTFRSKSSRVSFVRYALAMAVNFPLWSACIYLLATAFAVPVSVAAPSTTVLMILWNYAASRWAFLGRRDAALQTAKK
jgi:putative flippase GtrA